MLIEWGRTHVRLSCLQAHSLTDTFQVYDLVEVTVNESIKNLVISDPALGH